MNSTSAVRHSTEEFRVGVDAGGTFTDICAIEVATGKLHTHKVPSTTADPSQAVVTGVRELLTKIAGEEWASRIGFLAHGSTVATNALLEKKGARTGLITTAGFGDLLEIARQRRPSLYDLTVGKPEPLVKRRHRKEISERLNYQGRTLRELDEAEVRAVVSELARLDLEAVAVCFLYSYVNPAHEKVVTKLLTELAPDLYVSTSHEVVPEFREYERMSTTVLNSYVGPVVGKYLKNLKRDIRELGVDTEVHITQSNGGIISLDTACQQPARMMLSGPSTGLVASTHIGALINEPNIITFDMGGTSTDVSLIHAGRVDLAQESEIDGYPIRTPMLDINTVGAGGGSIAWVDSGGALKVGPQSAGAVPGPACYGKQNEFATVTDANVVLQTQNPEYLLGGRLKINAEASRRAVEALAGKLGLSAEYVADGMLRVVTANMAKAIRVISVQRGHDPRDYTLAAFGGAGPLHAGRLARELDIRRIIIPPSPGVMCAYGLMVTDLRTDLSFTKIVDFDATNQTELNDAVEHLNSEATRWFTAEKIPEGQRALRITLDMRYAGQNYELGINLADHKLDQAGINAAIGSFESEHHALYGFTVPGERIQAVTFRAEASGKVVKAATPLNHDEGDDPWRALIGERHVYFGAEDGFTPTPIYAREKLRTGNIVAGPAVIEQMDTTTVVLPGQTARTDGYANLIIEENEK